jgi:hypothetical protein
MPMTNRARIPLPKVPASEADFADWSAWAKKCAAARDWSVLRDAPSEQVTVALRAILAAWAGRTVAPDNDVPVASAFLAKCAEAPPHVVAAARRLLDESMHAGITTADVLYLAAAFVWVLDDIDPELADVTWQYLVHAPWQTEARAVIALCNVLAELGRAHRTLGGLADERQAAGEVGAARELLEAVVAAMARKAAIEDLTTPVPLPPATPVFGPAPALKLARIYRADEETEIHARAVMRLAAEESVGEFTTDLETRVWNRPFGECLQWAKTVEAPRQIDAEIAKVVDAGQGAHARALAEAVLVTRTAGLFDSASADRVPDAIVALKPERVREDFVLRRALEHLVVLYSRTNYVTSHARVLTRRILTDFELEFVAMGQKLHDARDELALFYARVDPYVLLDEQEVALGKITLASDEAAGRDAVHRWFGERAKPSDRGAVDQAVRAITLPVVELGKKLSNAVGVGAAVEAALRGAIRKGQLVTGDLGAVRAEGEALRGRHGVGKNLLDRALETSTEHALWAAGIAGGLSAVGEFVPLINPALRAVDIGATMIVAYRGVARVAALYGVDVGSDAGLRLVADALALGCSSNDADGMLGYLTRDYQRVVTPFAVGGVAYGGMMLAGHLWAAPQRTSDAAAAVLVRNLARFAGVALDTRSMAKVLPVAGAVLAGVSAGAFVKSVVEAAAYLQARTALLAKVE